MNIKQTLGKFKNREAKICIIGLGYVGLPLAIECLIEGYSIQGYDISQTKIDTLLAGHSDVLDVSADDVAKYINNGKFAISTSPDIIKGADVILICVPTPLSNSREPDISYIEDALGSIKEHIGKNVLVVLESTTYPGTTNEIIRPALEINGLEDGKNLFIAFSPERVDPGNPKYQTHNTPKVVGADFSNSLKVAEEFYKTTLETVVPVSSSMAAELVKLLENTFRSVNIALVNELAQMCELLKIDVWEVIDAAASKPFGFMPFYPGPGVGGHCIPIDPQYLAWKMKSHKYFSRFIELAGDINANMPRHVIYKVMDFLNENGLALTKTKVLILGLAYKKNISDVRESPALELLELLEKKCSEIDYFDPFVPSINWNGGKMNSIDLSEKTIKQYDLIVLATDHTDVDYDFIAASNVLVYDTRNKLKSSKTVRRLGT